MSNEFRISPVTVTDGASPPLDAGDLFPEPPEEVTTITSVPFDLDARLDKDDAEDIQLLEQYRQVARHGELGFALLVGEPGMGKSYTVSRFARAAGREEPRPRILRSEGDGSELAYAAFSRMMRERFGIAPSDSDEVARDRIVTGVSQVLQAARVTEVAHLIANLVGAPFPDSPVVAPLRSVPQQLETRTYMAIRRLLMADAQKAPVVVIIENLELCGPETVNLLHYLAAGLSSAPVFLVGTARRSLFARHPSFGEGDTPLRTIDIGVLDGDQAEGLLMALCRQLDEVPDILRSHARRLGGSPRAIIELMRLLLESEVIVRSGSLSWRIDTEMLATLKLPTSHEDLVMERVRVMAANEADVLEKAAAIGETFWLDAVVALVRAADHRGDDPDGPSLSEIAAAGDHSRVQIAQTLQSLIEREWIVPVKEPSLAGEREYRFAYPYLWSSVYDGVDPEHRRASHEVAAQWLDLRPETESLTSQEAIARHRELGGDARGAARAYRQAAEAARSSFANDKAIRLYAHALSCLGGSDPAARIRLWHDLGSVFELKGDMESALGAYERMLRLSWSSASRAKAAVAFNKMGRVWRKKGDLELALEYLERAQDLFEQASDATGIAGSLDDIGQVLYLLGRYDEAFEKITAGLSRRGKRGDQRSIAHSLSNLGNIQKDRGRFVEAENCHHEALAIRRSIGDRAGVVTSLNNLAVLAYERGNYTDAREGWQQALEEAEAIGSLPLQALALTNLGELARTENHPDEARRRLGEAIDIATDLHDAVLSSEATRNLALIEHLHGDPERARELAKRAHDIATGAGLRDQIGRTLLTLGEVYAGTLFDAGQAEDSPTDPEVKAAERYFSKGIEVLREIGNEVELGKGLERHGRYKIEQGDVNAGVALLREALGVFNRLGMREQQRSVQDLISSL